MPVFDIGTSYLQDRLSCLDIQKRYEYRPTKLTIVSERKEQHRSARHRAGGSRKGPRPGTVAQDAKRDTKSISTSRYVSASFSANVANLGFDRCF